MMDGGDGGPRASAGMCCRRQSAGQQVVLAVGLAAEGEQPNELAAGTQTGASKTVWRRPKDRLRPADWARGACKARVNRLLRCAGACGPLTPSLSARLRAGRRPARAQLEAAGRRVFGEH